MSEVNDAIKKWKEQEALKKADAENEDVDKQTGSVKRLIFLQTDEEVEYVNENFNADAKTVDEQLGQFFEDLVVEMNKIHRGDKTVMGDRIYLDVKIEYVEKE